MRLLQDGRWEARLHGQERHVLPEMMHSQRAVSCHPAALCLASLLGIVGLPILFVLGFGAILLLLLGVVLTIGLIAIKILLPIVLIVWFVRWIFGKTKGCDSVKGPPPPEEPLWTRAAWGDAEGEGALVERYYYLVRAAARTWRRKCRWVEADDLEQLAVLGLRRWHCPPHPRSPTR